MLGFVLEHIEDPGTAGDEGEENWADLLRDWLPQNYHIVTKGRILARNNEAGPQLDILVLKPDYPSKLLNKKHYLVGPEKVSGSKVRSVTAILILRCIYSAAAQLGSK